MHTVADESACQNRYCCINRCREQVTVLQEDGLLAEYVHILAGTALVNPGDQVTAGQPLCLSGGAGFCPTPHLHLQLQEGEGDTAPTVQFALLDCEGNPYFPVAGKWYGFLGEAPVSAPPSKKQPQGKLGPADALGGSSDQERAGSDGKQLDGIEGCGEDCADSEPRATSKKMPQPSR